MGQSAWILSHYEVGNAEERDDGQTLQDVGKKFSEKRSSAHPMTPNVDCNDIWLLMGRG